MPRIAGLVAAGGEVDLVILNFENAQFEFVSQATLKLPTGNSAQAYRVIHGQLQDQLRQANINCACVKSSALSTGGTKLAHLESAELRGVALAAAAAAGCEVRPVSKATTSRTFGNRKVDDYLKDDAFWDGLKLGTLKKGMRQAALMAISQFS